MSKIVSRIWQPVRRRGAEHYLQLTVLSFAASVSLTRLVLELTGFPQLGNEILHIAHVLYGGAILYAATLLPLLYANRWVYTWSAILSGLGVGLFIDEVGKFITQSNDYFFPVAAPIIYAVFLLTVLIYVRIRGDPELDMRGELYTVLEILQDVIDHSLELREYNEMKRRLDHIIATSKNMNYSRLAMELEDFVDGDALTPVEENINLFDRIISIWSKLESRYLSERLCRITLTTGFLVLGIPSFMRVTNFALVMGDHVERIAYINSIASGFPASVSNAGMWTLALILVDGIIGGLLTISSLLLLSKRRNWATQVASISLIGSLVAVNLVLFYVEQFSTIITAMAQFTTLQVVYYYQRKYGKNGEKLF